MFNNIQALRAFAAANVVLFHIIGTSTSYSQGVDILKCLEGWGGNGVDIFFVISGFVMLHTQMTQRRSPLQFIKNRVIRIAPIYWLITAVVLALYLALPSIFRGMEITPVWAVSSLLFTSSIFAGQHPVVYLGWTLEWEMFFYAMFALGLFFKKWTFQAATVAVAIAAISLLTGEFIAVEFLFGMLAACLFKQCALTRTQGVASFVLGSLLLLLTLSPGLADLDLDRALMWGIPSFFIVCGVVACPQLKGWLLPYLGDASYSIYLVQILTIPAFYKLSSRVLPDWNGDILALACLIFSVAVGCAVYSLLEKPINVELKRRFGS